MRARAIVLILVGAFGLAGSASAGTYSGGTGEPNDPYRIATANDLNDIGNHVEDFNKCFVMVNDINLADYNGPQFNSIGTSANPFAGVFDGNNRIVSNLSVGLFDRVDDPNAQIRNLTLTDPNIDGGGEWGVGALVGLLRNGIVHDCGVEGGRVSGGDYVGGLVGDTYCEPRQSPCYSAIISNCYSTSTVSGGSGIGGLIGSFDHRGCDSAISDCSSTGEVSGTDYVGGLVGYLENEISNCQSSAVVSGNDFVGGLIGSAGGWIGIARGCTEISDCNASGDVTAAGGGVGGLLGANYDSNVIDCYAAGTVSAEGPVGGLVGHNNGEYRGGFLTGCYATGDVSGDVAVGGLVGTNDEGTIAFCYAVGDVTCTDSPAGGLLGVNYYGNVQSSYSSGCVYGYGAHTIGGLIGSNMSGDVSNCYSTGNVSGCVDIGGLIAANYDSDVTNCYAAGRVEANEPFNGGLIGIELGNTYAGCMWDSEVNPDMNGIGSGSDPNVIGKSTTEMQTESTFTDAGWDFVEVWDIGENQTYPFLQVYPTGDIDHDDRVDWGDVAIMAGHWLEEE
jgi:hypothetical protein